MLFCAFVGTAFAQSIASVGSNITDLSALEEGTYVVLKNVGRNKYIFENSDNKMLHGNAASGKQYIWQVHLEDGGKYSFSSITGKYISTPLDGNDVYTVESTDERKDEFAITKHNENDAKWKLQSTNNQSIYWDGQAARFVGWQGSGTNSQFEIIPIELGEELTPIKSVEELNNSKLYTIVPMDAARGALYATSSSTCLDACGGTYNGAANKEVVINHKSADQQFAFYTHDGNTYLYAVGAGKFVGGLSDRYFSLVNTPSHAYTVEASSQDGYFIVKLDNSNYINVSTGWQHGCVGKWATEDDGNRLVITPVADVSDELATTLQNAFSTQRNFTYTFKYNGEVKYTQTCKGNVGDVYPEVNTKLFPYGVTATKPEGTIPTDVASNIDLTLTVGNLPFETAESAGTINTWYCVRMHTNQPGYIGDIADDKTVNVAWGKSSDEYNENYLWGFAGNIWDGITVVNKGTGLQLTSTGSGNATLTETGTPFFVARTTETSANATNGFCLRKKDSNQYLNANYGAAKLSHWGSTDAGSTFFLTEYNQKEVEVSNADYATLFLGQATYIPAGVEVYAVTEVANGYVKMELVEGVLPANSGVILKNEGSYTFKTAAKDAAAIEGNLLLGTVENTYVEGLAYVLGKDGDEVGLFKAALNKDANGNVGTTHFLNNANKAYLPVADAPQATLRFNFGGTTAIESVLNNGVDANAPIYDLSGRRVMNAVKGGIYIQNGKKFIVK